MIKMTGEVRAALVRIRHLCHSKGAAGRALQIDGVIMENLYPKDLDAFEQSHNDAKSYLEVRPNATGEDLAVLSTKSFSKNLNGFEQMLFSALRNEVPAFLET